MPPQLTHTKYRPDIDGLRAAAILAVVGYHAVPEWVRGGFIGVDVFFVISGYLISSIIFGNLEKDSFSFKTFYMRRVRRIFPALLTVLAACTIVGWFILYAPEFRQLGKHILASAGFSMNLMLWSESGYFDTDAITKPLLHIWSLGIEEQFYIVWPFLAWAAWKKNISLLKLTLGLGFISIVLHIIAWHDGIVTDFYSPETRFWELLAGALLAHGNIFKNRPSAWLKLDKRISQANRNNILSMLGMACLVVSVAVITGASRFPGFWVFMPVAGAMLLISAGPRAFINRHFLSNKPMRAIGLISYPLYLWHWPLLSFANIASYNSVSLTVRLGLIVISFLLAWGTYAWVENPLRYGNHARAKTTLLVALMVLVGVSGGFIWSQNGIPSRNFNQKFKHIANAIDNGGYVPGIIKDNINGITVYRTSKQPPEVLFFGDSHILQFNSYAMELAKKGDNIPSTMFLTSGGCVPVKHVEVMDHPECTPFFNHFEQLLKAMPSIHTVVIGAWWNGYFILYAKPNPSWHYYWVTPQGEHIAFEGGKARQPMMNQIAETLKQLSGRYKVYFVLDEALLPGLDPHKIVNRLYASVNARQPDIAVPEDQQELNRQLLQIGQSANVNVINQLPILCPGNACPRFRKGGTLWYRDSHHLRTRFIQQDATYLNPIFGLPKPHSNPPEAAGAGQ